MTNTNCLEGIACPNCGNATRISIETKAMASVTDEGAATFGDMEWDDESYAECPDCDYGGILRHFRITSTEQFSTQAEKE